MGHPLRLYEPDRVYEITSRTIQGRFLLRPSAEANELVLGVIGRAQALYPSVRVYAFTGISNHITWLSSSSFPEDIPSFQGFVNGNVSKELGALHDWPGKMWGRPQRPIPAVDEGAMIDRLQYVLGQGCRKEGLVDSPRQWPGPTCVHALLDGTPLRGTWFDRDLATKARRRGLKVRKYDFATEYEIRLDKLPCWAHLDDEEYTRRIARLIEQIEDETRIRRDREGRRSLGAPAVLAMEPHHRPDPMEKSPAPLCHASTSEARRSFRERYRTFVAAYRAAAERLKRGVLSVTFPLYAFPPRLPMTLAHARGSPSM